MGKTGIQSSKLYLRSTALLFLIFISFLMVSCGGGGSSAPPDTGSLSLSSKTLSFSYTIHAAAVPAPQTIQVSSTSGSEMDFSATTDTSNPTWMTVLPDNGTAPSAAPVGDCAVNPPPSNCPGVLTVTVSPKNLGAGKYTGHVIALGSGSRATATVTLTVASTTDPIMDVSPTSLSFTAVEGGSDPQPQLFQVKDDNAITDNVDLQFSLSTATDSGNGWLGACVRSTEGAPCNSTGVVTTSVSVEPHVGSLAPGTYTGKVTVTAASVMSGTINSPSTVDVTLTVTPAAPAVP
jgi:hypothetical protein